MANFRNLATEKKEKKGWRIRQRAFWEFSLKNRHILREKTKKRLEAARVGLCSYRSPKLGRIPKKIYLSIRTVAIYCQLMLRVLASAPTWGIWERKNPSWTYFFFLKKTYFCSLSIVFLPPAIQVPQTSFLKIKLNF